MYLQHFGLKHDPLGKDIRTLASDQQHLKAKEDLDDLLETRGIGLITGESGVGKTAGIREWVKTLNPLTYKAIYQVDNHFRGFDIYCQLGESLGLEPCHRYSRLWRNIKKELLHLYDEKKVTPVWILDEAQQLPLRFFADLPAFLNMSFDTKETMIILLVGTPQLVGILQRKVYASLASRIQFQFHWEAIEKLDCFSRFIETAFQNAGCQQKIMSEAGVALLHTATKGRLRYAHRVITRCLQQATKQNINHLPDDLIKGVIEQLRTMTH